MKNFIYLWILMIIWSVSFGQDAVLIGDGINSKYEEINPLLSPDGKTMYFVRVNSPDNVHGEDSEDIWYSEIDNNGNWGEAVNLKELNIAKYNAILGISENGNTMLIKNVYNKKGTVFVARGISLTTRTDGIWAPPQQIKIKGYKDAGDASSGYMTPDGNVIILSITDDRGGVYNDLYITEKNEKGEWESLTPLTDLNSPSSEDAPFLSYDRKTIYFTSTRSRGNRHKIYKAERKGQGWEEWSKPELLSPIINSKGWKSYFRTDFEGKFKYWSGTESRAKADIYCLKQRDFIVIAGKLLNANTGLPIKGTKFVPGENFELLANGVPSDSVVVDGGNYAAKIPANKGPIEATINAPHYQVEPVNVDPSKAIGGQEEVDFRMLPDPYVLIKGKMLVQNTGLPVPVDANPKILVNKMAPDAIKVDPIESDYEMQLPYGRAYDVELVGKDYQSLTRKIDLTKVMEFEERNMDLYVAMGNIATVRGRVTDAKTRRPVLGAYVDVEGYSGMRTEVDPTTGQYELKLPAGKEYNIQVHAPGYLSDAEPISAVGRNVIVYRDVSLAKLEVGASIRLNHIYFDYGKSTLKPSSFPELEKVIRIFKEYPHISAEIAGHTDNTSSAAHNLQLSRARAQSVVDYLVSKGIPRNQLIAQGYGLTRPIATNDTETGRAKNRRVEFVVLGL